jgi:hypothetical protein
MLVRLRGAYILYLKPYFFTYLVIKAACSSEILSMLKLHGVTSQKDVWIDLV